VLGHGERGHAEAGRLFDQLVDAARPIEERELRVEVKVDELRHDLLPYSHSIVDGGFELMSNTTRLIPFTSFTRRDEIVASIS
jgi:hypothetical protein